MTGPIVELSNGKREFIDDIFDCYKVIKDNLGEAFMDKLRECEDEVFRDGK